jgi:hypothetical protein
MLIACGLNWTLQLMSPAVMWLMNNEYTVQILAQIYISQQMKMQIQSIDLQIGITFVPDLVVPELGYGAFSAITV